MPRYLSRRLRGTGRENPRGRRADEAARTLVDFLEAPVFYFRASAIGWLAEGDASRFDDIGRVQACNRRLRSDPAWLPLAQAATAHPDESCADWVFPALLAQAERVARTAAGGPGGDADLVTLEQALVKAIRSRPAPEATWSCGLEGHGEDCLRIARQMRATGHPEAVVATLALLSAKQRVAASGGFATYAERHFSGDPDIEPRRLAEILGEEIDAIGADLAPELQGLPCLRALDEGSRRPLGVMNADFDPRDILAALLATVGDLFSLRFEPRPDLPLWNGSVRAWEVFEAEGGSCRHGLLIADLIERKGKEPGLGVNPIACRELAVPGPLVSLEASMPARDDRLAQQLGGLVHELGHCLDTLLQRDYRPLYEDLVPMWHREFSSSFMETLLLEGEFLSVLGRRYAEIAGQRLDFEGAAATCLRKDRRSRIGKAWLALVDLELHSLGTAEVTRELVEEAVRRTESRLPLPYCREGGFQAASLLSHPAYACNRWCYSLGQILSRRLAAGIEHDKGRDLRARCAAMKGILTEGFRSPLLGKEIAGLFATLPAQS